MNKLHPTIEKWFECWRTGDIDNLPVTKDFRHTSPFGTIEPRQRYLEIVEKNREDFLGNQLTVFKQIQEGDMVCVQFDQKNASTGLEMTVCEWYDLEGELIREIRSFYNVGDAQITG